MFSNYLKITFRYLLRYKGYSFINIFGLAIGITCCLLILLFVRDELSYDSFHEKGNRIYRLVAEGGLKNEIEITSCNTSFPLGPALNDNFPEVRDAVRFREGYQSVVGYRDNHFNENSFYFVDQSVFEMFTFKFERGGQAALVEPNSVVLTETTARRYFGDDDPIGKVLSYSGWGGKQQLTVTGVLRNLPHNTHFEFDFLASLNTIDTSDFSWTWFTSLWTYILLPENYDPHELVSKFPKFVDDHLPASDKIDPKSTLIMDLEPLSKIHLYSGLENQMKPVSDIDYVYLFSMIAFFMLVIACINFMNLATARSLKRAKEVGMRKTLGARRTELIKQFLGESFCVTLIALFLAVMLLEFLLPSFNMFTGKDIQLFYFTDWFLMIGLFGLTLVVGLASGIYPAFFLSGFRPLQAIKSLSQTDTGRNPGLREALVVFQFGISTILILSTVVVYHQLQFIRDKNLGANVDQVVVLPYSENIEPMVQRMVQNPRILNVTSSSRIPLNIDSWDTRPILVEGFEKAIQMENFNIDESFLATFQIDLVAGRNLSPEFVSDSSAFLINEAAVRHFGWSSPETAIGKRLGWQNGYRWGQIVGVVEDFHMVSLHESIAPLVMTKLSQHFWYNYISVRIRTSDTARTLEFIESIWREFTPEGGYEYFFADDSFARLHEDDKRFGEVFGIFSLISILIACLGLFALAAFAAEQRKKEIVVRKVVGASVTQVVRLLTKQFILLVILAFLIAAPIAWLAMNKWLDNFAYRISIGPIEFILCSVMIVSIAFFTVSYQSIRAALTNPAEALRYE